MGPKASSSSSKPTPPPPPPPRPPLVYETRQGTSKAQTKREFLDTYPTKLIDRIEKWEKIDAKDRGSMVGAGRLVKNDILDHFKAQPVTTTNSQRNQGLMDALLLDFGISYKRGTSVEDIEKLIEGVLRSRQKIWLEGRRPSKVQPTNTPSSSSGPTSSNHASSSNTSFSVLSFSNSSNPQTSTSAQASQNPQAPPPPPTRTFKQFAAPPPQPQQSSSQHPPTTTSNLTTPPTSTSFRMPTDSEIVSVLAALEPGFPSLKRAQKEVEEGGASRVAGSSSSSRSAGTGASNTAAAASSSSGSKTLVSKELQSDSGSTVDELGESEVDQLTESEVDESKSEESAGVAVSSRSKKEDIGQSTEGSRKGKEREVAVPEGGDERGKMEVTRASDGDEEDDEDFSDDRLEVDLDAGCYPDASIPLLPYQKPRDWKQAFKFILVRVLRYFFGKHGLKPNVIGPVVFKVLLDKLKGTSFDEISMVHRIPYSHYAEKLIVESGFGILADDLDTNVGYLKVVSLTLQQIGLAGERNGNRNTKSRAKGMLEFLAQPEAFSPSLGPATTLETSPSSSSLDPSSTTTITTSSSSATSSSRPVTLNSNTSPLLLPPTLPSSSSKSALTYDVFHPGLAKHIKRRKTKERSELAAERGHHRAWMAMLEQTPSQKATFYKVFDYVDVQRSIKSSKRISRFVVEGVTGGAVEGPLNTAVAPFGDSYLPSLALDTLPQRFPIFQTQLEYLNGLKSSPSRLSSHSFTTPILVLLQSPGTRATPGTELATAMSAAHIRASVAFRALEQSFTILHGRPPPLPLTFDISENPDQIAVNDTHSEPREAGQQYQREPEAAIQLFREILSTTDKEIIIVLPISRVFADLILLINQPAEFPHQRHQLEASINFLHNRRGPIIFEFEEKICIITGFPTPLAAISHSKGDPSPLQLLSLIHADLALSLRSKLKTSRPRNIDKLEVACSDWSKEPRVVAAYELQHFLLGRSSELSSRIRGHTKTAARLANLGIVDPSPALLGLLNKIPEWKGQPLDDLGLLGTTDLLVFTGLNKPANVVVRAIKNGQNGLQLLGPREVLLLVANGGQVEIQTMGFVKNKSVLDPRANWLLSSDSSSSPFHRTNLEDGTIISCELSYSAILDEVNLQPVGGSHETANVFGDVFRVKAVPMPEPARALLLRTLSTASSAASTSSTAPLDLRLPHFPKAQRGAVPSLSTWNPRSSNASSSSTRSSSSKVARESSQSHSDSEEEDSVTAPPSSSRSASAANSASKANPPIPKRLKVIEETESDVEESMDVDEKPPSRIPDGVEVISLLDSDGDEMMVPVQPTPKPKPAVQPTPKPTGNAWGLLGKKKETAAQPTLTSASNANSSHTSAVTVISSDDADSDSPSEAKRIKKKTELYEEGYVCYGCGADLGDGSEGHAVDCYLQG